MSFDLKQAALDYHNQDNRPGKLSVELTKPTKTPADLSLAYSPGVAHPVVAIAENPALAYKYTGKGNLVGVISNGTAILGLGALGALASKPVMEGKGVLFKAFGGVDVFDIEVETRNIDEFVTTVKNISPTFGGINLEDIKAPECFEIEKQLIEACACPVFHDDSHGTAIITAAAMLNALDQAKKELSEAKIVCLGAGAAAIWCMKLLVSLGAKHENIFMLDTKGVIRKARTDLNQYKAEFAVDTEKVTLAEAMVGADVFVGLSGPNLVTADMLKTMAKDPIVFACSNPDPEISPELCHATRDDVIVATGRSDYPNQVNNVLAFPFIFRGALDVAATRINLEMKLAATYALRDLARLPVPDSVKELYNKPNLAYGREYLIPTPFDPRLITVVSDAVAKAAIATGVATKPYPANYPLQSVADVFKTAAAPAQL